MTSDFYAGGDRMTTEFYTNGEYTADISNKMRVPDRIMAHSDAGDWNETQNHDQRDVFNMQVPDRISARNDSNLPDTRKYQYYEREVFDMKVPDKIAAHDDGGNFDETINHDHTEVINMKVPDKIAAHRESGNWSDTMHDQYIQAVNMQVPERIQLAGSDQHVSSKSTPRELQLEPNVIHPTPEHVRVNTPPRSLKLEEMSYPCVSEEPFRPSPVEMPSPFLHSSGSGSIKLDDITYPTYPTSDDPRQFPPSPQEKSTFRSRHSPMTRGLDKGISCDADTSLSTYGHTDQNLSTNEEIQLMKRQIAKLNHRLMATELENQQQQQRELVFTIAVSAYFLVKALLWINKSI